MKSLVTCFRLPPHLLVLWYYLSNTHLLFLFWASCLDFFFYIVHCFVLFTILQYIYFFNFLQYIDLFMAIGIISVICWFSRLIFVHNVIVKSLISLIRRYFKIANLVLCNNITNSITHFPLQSRLHQNLTSFILIVCLFMTTLLHFRQFCVVYYNNIASF